MRNLVSHKVLVGCGVFGVAFLIAGTLISYKFIPDMIDTKIWEAKVLKNGTDQMEMFKKVPFPFTFKVYFFNVENPDGISRGEKPIVREVGPYVYNIYHWKEDITWNITNNEDISYEEFERYEFNKKASRPLSDEDFVTILNTPVLAFLMTAEEMSPDALPTISDTLPAIFGDERSGVFIKTKVKDYLFNGIELCKNRGVDGGFASKMICSQIIAKLNSTKAMKLVNEAVSFANLRHKNVTGLGISTIKSGNQIREETGLLIAFNNKKYQNVWPDPKSTCNKIKGRTSIFPNNLTPKMIFESFSPDLCRVLSMSYKGEDTIKDITGFKYTALNDSFWLLPNTTNFCFCLNNSKKLDGTVGCIDDGLMDLSVCTGAPLLLSFPHLLHANEKYLDSVDGLYPEEKLHETFVTLEPNTGMPLEIAKRVQFNMFLRPMEDVAILENVTNSLVPLLWVEESYTLDDQYTDIMKGTILKVMKILGILRWVILVVGGATIIIPFFCLIYMD